tara:strand:+ start:13 stop:294 length:282 start_codon:yes stop_codon:yes gene_type:complete
MSIKPTFFNTRKERLHWNYSDTNNYLFTIIFNNGAELNLILRDLKKNDNIVNYIYKKLNDKFINILEIHSDKLSLIEYNLLKLNKTPSVNKIC